MPVATARANREAFDRWRIVPHMLTGATQRELSTTVLGTQMSAPVITSPIGVQAIVHPDAELAVARVAKELGIVMTLSTVSSVRLEDVAEECGDGPRWFQLYWPNDPDVCISMLERAKAAGFTALVVTLDTWLLGWRPHDLDTAYLPFLTGEGLVNYFTDPAFLSGLDKPPAEDLQAALIRWLPMFSGTDHTWDEIAFLQEHWDGPILLKGIQDVDDARRAVDAGVQGVLVSNHGGRQVDGAIGALDALPADRRCGRRPGRGAVRLRHPDRRGHRQGAGARCARGPGRPALGLRARPGWDGRGAARAAQPAGRLRPVDGAVRSSKLSDLTRDCLQPAVG